jgi:opacity protein-like surface antigen
MRSLVISVFTAVVLVAVAPTSARAQAYLSPFVGEDVGGDAGTCPSIINDCAEKKTSYGVTLGALIGGIFGFEEDLGYAPHFFGQSASLGDSSLLTLMSNVVVSVPLPLIRPYASGGVGLIRSHVGFNIPSVATADDNAFGYDIGGGAMVRLPYHLGVKGDVRYFRSPQNLTISGISFNNTQLNFYRVSIGLLLH